jgi:cytochrome c
MRRTALIMALALALSAGAAFAAEADTAAGKAVYTAKCQSCHGADGSKHLLSKPVKGLKAEAALAAMQGYKAKTFGGTKKAVMENLAAQLSDADIKAVAAYIGTL